MSWETRRFKSNFNRKASAILNEISRSTQLLLVTNGISKSVNELMKVFFEKLTKPISKKVKPCLEPLRNVSSSRKFPRNQSNGFRARLLGFYCSAKSKIEIVKWWGEAKHFVEKSCSCKRNDCFWISQTTSKLRSVCKLRQSSDNRFFDHRLTEFRCLHHCLSHPSPHFKSFFRINCTNFRTYMQSPLDNWRIKAQFTTWETKENRTQSKCGP